MHERFRWNSRGLFLFLLAPLTLGLSAGPLWAGQAEQEVAGLALPDAPEPQTTSPSPTPKPNPCEHGHPTNGKALLSGGQPADPEGAGGVHPATVPCTKKPLNLYQRFANGPKRTPLTPADKGWLAARNVLDPFNLITIGGEAGISVAADSHSPYGPGMPGYGRYVGVSLTEDITGEFFGTFLIPSIAHQNPHYRRIPKASIPARFAHAVVQVAWTDSDSGKGMPNYANLVGFAIDDEIANLYVPGRQTNASASTTRYAIGLATAPIGNLVNEFLPDVASHIHVQIVILQRIINQVALRTQNNSSAGSGIF